MRLNQISPKESIQRLDIMNYEDRVKLERTIKRDRIKVVSRNKRLLQKANRK